MNTWITRDSTSGTGPRVAVKDLIDMAGLPTTAGSRAVAVTAKPAAVDAACVAGLRAALREGRARFAGKVNLHELAYGITGINDAFGTPVNPLDPRRVPGGSSSGSAVAVASEDADIAYGSDTGGSVRIPAACCGITGLKTTWGRIPLDGVYPLAPELDTIGPMARDIAGVATGMALLEPGFTIADDAPATIGLLLDESTAGDAIVTAPHAGATARGTVSPLRTDPVIATAITSALHTAEFDVRPVVVPDIGEVAAAAFAVLDAAAWRSNASLVASSPNLIGTKVLDRLQGASRITPSQVASARVTVASWKATLDALWHRVDLLAVPVLNGFPPLLEDADSIFRIRGITSPVNVAGLPALALPIPTSGPIPASLQLIGPANSEDRLLTVGARIEQAVSR